MSETAAVEPATAFNQLALIEMTAEQVAAYVTKNHVRAAELPDLMSTVHASLSGMGKALEPAPEPPS